MKIHLMAEYDASNDLEHERALLDKVRKGLYGFKGAVWTLGPDGNSWEIDLQ